MGLVGLIWGLGAVVGPAAILASGPTATPAPTVAPPELPLRAWDVAADGQVFGVDAANNLYRLAAHTLQPVTKVAAPLAAVDQLGAGSAYLFLGSKTVSQTVILNRLDFRPVLTLNQVGPLAYSDRYLVMIPRTISLPLYQGLAYVYDLADLSRPPRELWQDCAYLPGPVVVEERLYQRIHNICFSPPHQRESLAIYRLDTLTQTAQSGAYLGALSRPAVAGGDIALALRAKNDFYANHRLLILDQQGAEIQSGQPLAGIPAVAGEWLYLLRERGLWLLRADDLSLQSIRPFTTTPPADLRLSPDGRTVYLFGNAWLAAWPTDPLQGWGFPPLSPLPAAWTEAEGRSIRLYRAGETRLAQVGSYGGRINLTEATYRSPDGGESWHLVRAFAYPSYHNVQQLSLWPGGPLTAHTFSDIFRSTDGGQSWQTWQPPIAFVSERDGNRELYTMNQTGQDVRRLTNTPAAEENPAWSPAWSQLAFQSDRTGNWDLFRMPVDGGAAVRLTTDPADDLLPAWSPDGRSIAFVSLRDGNPEIYLMDADGQNQRRLTFNPTGDWRPAWLPDSRRLLFTSDRTGNNDIYQLTVPDGDAPPTAEPPLTPLVATDADERDPAIGRGEELLFLADGRIHRLDLRDPYGRPWPVNETGRPAAHPSPVDNVPYTLLVAVEEAGDSDIYRVIGEDYTRLTDSPAFDGQPAWGPVLWESVALFTTGP